LLAADYDVRLPVALHDGTRSLGKVGEGTPAFMGGRLLMKPTSVFFPMLDRTMTIESGEIAMQAPRGKPLLVVGFTAQDADCLEFIDEFFATDEYDDIYFNKRKGAVTAVISGRCGADGEFLKLSAGNCDFELICDGKAFLAIAHSEAGKAIVEEFSAGMEVDGAVLEELRRESDALPVDDKELIERASKLLLDDKAPDEFWTEIAGRCIACTACNLVCPTCTCFDVFDVTRGSIVERFRMWDSCQLDGFMREAGGHNPMGEEKTRTRRRIHHKLGADVTRWGTISCFLCGRCDDVCPSGIGIKAVCREMLERYG